MDINCSRQGDVLNVSFSGDMCAECVPATEAFLKENLGGVTKLTLDFGNVRKLTNEGLMLLLSTRKKLGAAGMKIVNVGEELYDSLEKQGVTTLIDVEKAG